MKPIDKRWIRLLDRPVSRTLYAVACVLLLWLGLHLALGARLIPSPGQTLIRFFTHFPDVLSRHLLASLIRILAALTAKARRVGE